MKNPYEVLGVTSAASMDEVKRAYRDKARQYSDDPAKMNELNAAYDMIINNFSSNRTDTSYSDNRYASSAGQTSEFGDIRAKLNSGRIDDAETLLDGIPYQRRNAEWYYLKGMVLYRKGWLDEAYNHVQRACQMDPYNNEYRAQLNRMSGQRGYAGSSRDDQMCDCCCSMMAANCLCNMCCR